MVACQTAQEAKTKPAARTTRTLEQILAQNRTQNSQNGSRKLAVCLGAAARAHPCPSYPPRTLGIRIFLDPRYVETFPQWERRLAQTLNCVNRIYAKTQVSWEPTTIEPWPPGVYRHNLRGLLARLQQEHPYDGQTLTLGITVWDKHRAYSQAAGEIGLSQHTACVVPSWPRIENDCLILAHELGHLVRARHVPGKHWVMSWAASPFHLPATDPVARVISLYRIHPRNQLAITMHRGATFTPGGLALRISCVQQLDAVDRCWKLSAKGHEDRKLTNALATVADATHLLSDGHLDPLDL